MQFALTEEQNLLKDAVEKFVRDRYGDNQRREYRAEARGYSPANWQMLADMGLLGLPFASEEGGLGGGARELVVIAEALGRGYAVEPVLEELIVAGGVLAAVGDARQKSAWLPRIMSGEAHLALAHFEHAARFNLPYVGMQASRRGAVTVLNGAKMVVAPAGDCDQWIVSARLHGDAADPSGIGFFLVTPSAVGIERRELRMADGSCASSIRFRDVTALERLPGDYATFATAIDTARLAAGAEMLGIMTTMFDSTLEYLRSRRQFGVPLASFQALQHRAADLYVMLEQSRSQVYRAMLCTSGNLQRERAMAGMKSYVGTAAMRIGEECVHLHGGIGTTDELALGHGYKRLLVLTRMFGDANAELTRYCKLAG